MSAAEGRRGFLRGLVTLPLIGGGVTLIGQPTGVAEPVTRTLLAQYWNWLHYERRLLCIEMADGNRRLEHQLKHTIGLSGFEAERGRSYPEFHFPLHGSWTDVPRPSTRAALVMGAVGFDWRPAPG